MGFTTTLSQRISEKADQGAIKPAVPVPVDKALNRQKTDFLLKQHSIKKLILKLGEVQ